MTKYEYARLMAARVTELAQNAPPLIQEGASDSILSPLRVAEAEFAAGALPLKLVRRLPGTTEVCSTDRLCLIRNSMNHK